MSVGCIQWDFKGAWNVKTPVQPDRECCCAQTLALCGTNINLAAGTGTSTIHHCMAVSAALPLEQPLQLFPHWGSPWPPFPVSGRQVGGRGIPTTSSFSCRLLKQPQEQHWCWEGRTDASAVRRCSMFYWWWKSSGASQRCPLRLFRGH